MDFTPASNKTSQLFGQWISAYNSCNISIRAKKVLKRPIEFLEPLGNGGTIAFVVHVVSGAFQKVLARGLDCYFESCLSKALAVSVEDVGFWPVIR